MQASFRQFFVAWLRQFGFVFAAYIAALAVSSWTLKSDAAGAFRTALIVAPIVPGLALIGLTVRAYTLSDEFIRFRILQAAAVAATVMAGLSLAYFFLELLGLPRLSAAWSSNIIWIVFVAQMTRLSVTGR